METTDTPSADGIIDLRGIKTIAMADIAMAGLLALALIGIGAAYHVTSSDISKVFLAYLAGATLTALVHAVRRQLPATQTQMLALTRLLAEEKALGLGLSERVNQLVTIYSLEIQTEGEAPTTLTRSGAAHLISRMDDRNAEQSQNGVNGS